MIKVMLSIFLFFFLTMTTYCQKYEQLFYGNKKHLDIPIHLASQVHSLDDFIGRFNGYHNNLGEAVDRNSSLFKQIYNNKEFWNEYRRKIIGSLITKELFYTDSIAVQKFARMASLGDDLDFYRNIDHVIVPVTGKWNNKIISAVIQMKLSVDKQKKSCWQIDKVHFNQKIDISKYNMIVREICNDIFIPPSAQDNGFISLNKVLKGETSLHHHITKATKEISQLNHMIAEDNYHPTFENYSFSFNIDSGYSFIINEEYRIIKIIKK